MSDIPDKNLYLKGLNVILWSEITQSHTGQWELFKPLFAGVVCLGAGLFAEQSGLEDFTSMKSRPSHM